MAVAKNKDYILKYFNANVKDFSPLPPAARGALFEKTAPLDP
jgi:hypothetical protein